ncbi:MAG: CRTAC1 family protein, partial [Planctomycetaceae bacterium]
DVREALGIDHVYQNGDTGRLLMVESIGGGGGWLDYDGDQRWDIYLGQGGDPVRSGMPDQPSDRLVRQLPDGRFEDVTAAAGIVETRYGQGVAVGDFDDDGFDDVYVTNVGRNTLWRNQGDGTFLDVTMAAGVGDERWSSSAAWGDLDGDGDLDLYVANYCDFDVHNPRDCSKDGKPHICHPLDVPPVPDECYMNQGDGTFTAEATTRGLRGEGGRALGVVIADLDNDGDSDVYVANDMTANFLFVNDGKGQFRESGILLGCAVDRNGAPQASMGVACGDYDGNGFLDLYCTHFQFDYNTLYQNLGPSGMRDITGLVGLVAPTMPLLAFGTVMHDFDRNGRQELFVVNGHVERTQVRGTTVFEMEPQLFAYDGKRFHDCSKMAGDYFREKRLGRAVASCDFDDDGDLDLLVVNQNAQVALLRNDSAGQHGIAFRFRGRTSNRRGVGTRVTSGVDGRRRMQEWCGGTSYAAPHQPDLIFGLGEITSNVRAMVRWPSGREQTLEGLAVDRRHVLEEPD